MERTSEVYSLVLTSDAVFIYCMPGAEPSNLLFSNSFFNQVEWTSLGLPRRHSGKESICQCKRYRFDPWVGKIPWSRKPTTVFLPGKFLDRGAWWAIIHGFAKNRTQLSTYKRLRGMRILYLSFGISSYCHNSAV